MLPLVILKQPKIGSHFDVALGWSSHHLLPCEYAFNSSGTCDYTGKHHSTHQPEGFTTETKLIPSSSLSALSLSSFSALSPTFLYKTLLFPLPSCSISTSVTALTFPPLRLPPSSPPVSSLPSLCSLSLFLSQSVLRHRATVPKIQLQSRCLSGLVSEGWLAGRRGAEGGGGITSLSLSLNGTVPSGDSPSTESHLHTRQPDKHKWEELVDVKAPGAYSPHSPFILCRKACLCLLQLLCPGNTCKNMCHWIIVYMLSCFYAKKVLGCIKIHANALALLWMHAHTKFVHFDTHTQTHTLAHTHSHRLLLAILLKAAFKLHQNGCVCRVVLLGEFRNSNHLI